VRQTLFLQIRSGEIINNIIQKDQLDGGGTTKFKKEIVIVVKFHNNGGRCAVQTEDMTTHYS
jgi:hypothetical protein